MQNSPVLFDTENIDRERQAESIGSVWYATQGGQLKSVDAKLCRRQRLVEQIE